MSLRQQGGAGRCERVVGPYLTRSRELSRLTRLPVESVELWSPGSSTPGGPKAVGEAHDVGSGAALGTLLGQAGLLDTPYKLAGWKVSVIAMSGMTFELGTPHGRMMATMLAGIAQFERELLSERVKSSLAAARARGKKLGRQPGQRPKSERLAPKVLHTVGDGRSYRWIAHDLGISKNTVADIAKRHRESLEDFAPCRTRPL